MYTPEFFERKSLTLTIKVHSYKFVSDIFEDCICMLKWKVSSCKAKKFILKSLHCFLLRLNLIIYDHDDGTYGYGKEQNSLLYNKAYIPSTRPQIFYVNKEVKIPACHTKE